MFDRARAPDEEHDGGSVEEGRGRGDGSFEVFCEPPVSIDPGEEALDDPAPGLNRKADLIGFARTILTAMDVAEATVSPA